MVGEKQDESLDNALTAYNKMLMPTKRAAVIQGATRNISGHAQASVVAGDVVDNLA